MNCEQARNLFDAYLDGELSPALETELHAHRLQCPACRHELAVMEVAGHVIHSDAGEPKLDADFSNRLLACIEPVAEPRRRRYRLVVRVGTGLAAAACLTLAVLSQWRPKPQVAGKIVDGPAVSYSDGPTTTTGAAEHSGTTEEAGPALEEAAARLRNRFEDVVLQTRESSSTLKELGQMTLLELFDALQLEELTEPEPVDAQDDWRPAEEADDVENL